MYLHIGNRVIVSDKIIVGIFNENTIMRSEYNKRLKDYIKEGVKTIIVDRSNNVITSMISPYTIIKRGLLGEGIVWRRNHD